MEERTYALPQSLVNAIAATLNEMPAKLSRGILNEIEAHVFAIDKAENEAALERVRAEAREAVQA